MGIVLLVLIEVALPTIIGLSFRWQHWQSALPMLPPETGMGQP